ncbi:hypothetical protein [Halobacillus hunanensis]|uniref:hypothetical protein n=1 Tax=Halobacillus hunanensis TaxID=578214 RepID=UPI0009A89500|nr:hypothetical protein [Halobacillus hunanensis]
MRNLFDIKRLMYNNSEDLYFITYNIILLLYHLHCKSEKKQFKDYRKLAFLIPIISDEKKTRILIDYYKGKVTPNNNIHKELNRIYYDSIENIILIRYVLVIMERKGIINLVADTNKTNLFINDIEEFELFAEDKRFNTEKQRILAIKKNINSLSRLNYMTFVNEFFKRNGVAIWEN